jgi:hypothetical protein
MLGISDEFDYAILLAKWLALQLLFFGVLRFIIFLCWCGFLYIYIELGFYGNSSD